ncbi:substrate-binding periplasmic protein [Roseateles oligotrophus]|uniref:Transporter substrate-binding domain-containing protein n=1 Tax=Roseateles oligotrophus TaxID=1769250 RepID=A0ABT2YJ34_9BURK|nr:transporter substrate-binding domain-containing protein [Roseateles oligotrophus]MCV2370087.1 transporter substrate-binding domain-containing protein [Roseateles oligotrophus]
MKRRELMSVAMAMALALALALMVSASQLARAQTSTPDLQGFTENLPPLNFTATGSSGEAAGFGVELLRLMAREAGLSLDIQVQPWIRAMRSAGEANNTVLFSLARLPEREPQFQWVGPISERRIVIYRLSKRSDIRFTGLEQLQGLRLGVVRESASAKHLLALGLKPEVDLEWGSDDASNLRKLLAGRMDLLVMLDWAAAWHLRQHKLPFSSLTEVAVLDASLSYWYGLHLQIEPSVKRRLQTALDHIKRDGRYAALRLRYFD